MKVVVVAAPGEATAIEASLRASGYATVRDRPNGLSSDAQLGVVVDGGDRESSVAAIRTLRVARGATFPLLAVSTHADTDRLRALVEAGANDYIVWPRDADQLELRVGLRTSTPPPSGRQAITPASGAFHKELIDALPDPVYVKDEDGLLVMVNESFCALTGCTRDELLGKHAPSLFAEATNDGTVADVHASDERVRANGDSPEAEVTFTDKTGRVRALATKKALLRDAAGRKLVVGIIRDLTNRRELETQILMSDRLLSVGTLAAGMAHEINNPLAYVLGNVGFVADSLPKLSDPSVDHKALTEEMQRALVDTMEGARRVRDIVRDLHAFSNTDPAPLETADVRQAIAASLRMVWGEVKNRARLVLDVGRVPHVRATEARLGHVFVNLLVNAAQSFAVPGAAENEITIRARADADDVIVEVTDNGSGMTEDVARKIFDPFFTTRPVGEGAGLGLFVSHSIVRSIGGRIEIDTKLGRSTTFTVRLPIARTEGTVADIGRSSSPPARAVRVLVIDDEPRIGAVVSRMLSRGFVVDVVNDPREALAKISANESFDAILCEVMLPGTSGMAFYESIDPMLQSRVVFATAGGFTDDVRTFLERFPGRVLNKPFDRETLRTAIRGIAAQDDAAQ